MWASILSFLFTLLGFAEKLLTKAYSKENFLREKANREAKIQDEAELAASLANSPDEKLKQDGIDRMRDLISE